MTCFWRQSLLDRAFETWYACVSAAVGLVRYCEARHCLHYSLTFAGALQAEKVRTMRTACTRMIESRPDLPKTYKLVPPACYGRSLKAEPELQFVHQPEVSLY